MAEELNPKKQLDVLIRSRSKTFFNGKAEFVTSTNKTGVFDVLPFHANFITMVDDFITVSLPGGKSQRFEIQGGVLRVIEDKVDIYLTV